MFIKINNIPQNTEEFSDLLNIVKNKINLKCLYKLHNNLTDFRIKNNKYIIFSKTSLNKKDKNYYSILNEKK